MASPLSKGLIAGAIGESGAVIQPTLPPVPLAEARAHRHRLRDRRRRHVARRRSGRCAPIAILEATARPGTRFPIVVDGYFLPKTVPEIFAAGQQARVPLLAGWNSQESGPAASSDRRRRRQTTTPRRCARSSRIRRTRRSSSIPGRRPNRRCSRRPISPAIGSSGSAPGSGSRCTGRPPANRSTGISIHARDRRCAPRRGTRGRRAAPRTPPRSSTRSATWRPTRSMRGPRTTIKSRRRSRATW